jgi:hypothetical protein
VRVEAVGVEGVGISLLGGIVVGVGGWLVVATVLGVLIARMIRLRDRQVPRPDASSGPSRPNRDASGARSAPPHQRRP